MIPRSVITGAFLLISCATTPSTAPQAMSAAEHAAAARRAEESAAEHLAQYDSRAWQVRTCPPRYGEHAPVCWADSRNPTAGHLEEAGHRHDEAERHRAASRALREAEETACAGVAPADREWSPFDHGSDIVRVEALTGGGQVTGAVTTFRPALGLTPEVLERIAACHIARNAVLGPTGNHLEACPLAVPGVRFRAAESPEGIVLELRAEGAAQARELLARARAAIGHSP